MRTMTYSATVLSQHAAMAKPRSDKKANNSGTIAQNRRARHDYFLE